MPLLYFRKIRSILFQFTQPIIEIADVVFLNYYSIYLLVSNRIRKSYKAKLLIKIMGYKATNRSFIIMHQKFFSLQN